jgi:hypothetical protein
MFGFVGNLNRWTRTLLPTSNWRRFRSLVPTV